MTLFRPTDAGLQMLRVESLLNAKIGFTQAWRAAKRRVKGEWDSSAGAMGRGAMGGVNQNARQRDRLTFVLLPW